MGMKLRTNRQPGSLYRRWSLSAGTGLVCASSCIVWYLRQNVGCDTSYFVSMHTHKARQTKIPLQDLLPYQMISPNHRAIVGLAASYQMGVKHMVGCEVSYIMSRSFEPNGLSPLRGYDLWNFSTPAREKPAQYLKRGHFMVEPYQ
jgi:hypothetical protein